MSNIFEKIKEFILGEKEEVDTTETLKFMIYDQIVKLLNDYKPMVYEVEALEKDGLEHYFKKEVQEKILALIEESEDVLTIQEENNKENLGMRFAELKLDKLVMRALDNEEASLQQDMFNRNIGMISAEKGLEDCVIKALDNPIASLQQNIDKENMGMLAVKSCMERATFKALDNEEACTQKNETGKNMGMLTAIFISGDRCLLKALDNKKASLQQDEDGWTIGRYCACIFNEKAVLKALDNEEACLLRDISGRNLGMWCAMYGLEEATMKALDNKKASAQTDRCGSHIGNYCVNYGLEECAKKSLEIDEIFNSIREKDNLMIDRAKVEEMQGVVDRYNELLNIKVIEPNFQKIGKTAQETISNMQAIEDSETESFSMEA